MKNPLYLFIIFTLLIVISGLAYNKYCTSKPEGCGKSEPYDERELGDDHMDAK